MIGESGAEAPPKMPQPPVSIGTQLMQTAEAEGYGQNQAGPDKPLAILIITREYINPLLAPAYVCIYVYAHIGAPSAVFTEGENVTNR